MQNETWRKEKTSHESFPAFPDLDFPKPLWKRSCPVKRWDVGFWESVISPTNQGDRVDSDEHRSCQSPPESMDWSPWGVRCFPEESLWGTEEGRSHTLWLLSLFLGEHHLSPISQNSHRDQQKGKGPGQGLSHCLLLTQSQSSWPATLRSQASWPVCKGPRGCPLKTARCAPWVSNEGVPLCSTPGLSDLPCWQPLTTSQESHKPKKRRYSVAWT